METKHLKQSMQIKYTVIANHPRLEYHKRGGSGVLYGLSTGYGNTSQAVLLKFLVTGRAFIRAVQLVLGPVV